MKKINEKTQPGLKALKKVAPGAVKNMGYMKNGGDVKVDEVIRMPKEIQIPGMMGGGMMNYKYGGQAKKMMGGGMMYKDGGDVQTVTQGHKGMKNTVKYK